LTPWGRVAVVAALSLRPLALGADTPAPAPLAAPGPASAAAPVSGAAAAALPAAPGAGAGAQSAAAATTATATPVLEAPAEASEGDAVEPQVASSDLTLTAEPGGVYSASQLAPLSATAAGAAAVPVPPSATSAKDLSPTAFSEGPDTEQDLSPTAAGATRPPRPKHRPPAPLPFSRWSDHGLEYRFSMGELWLYNGQALSYMPLELGWRFANGLRLRVGMEAFFYQGRDSDPTTISNGSAPTLFTYQMLDLRASCLYVWPIRSRLRPLAGVTLETVGMDSTRQVATPNSNLYTTSPFVPNSEAAYSFLAPGVEAGLEYRGGPGWALSATGRYALGAGPKARLGGVDVGVHYLF
jgi:hypothetical protein